MSQVVDWYFKTLKIIVALCLLVMVVLVFGNVVLRYGFNSGITVSEELSRWAFVWLTFIGASVALRENAHLGMDTVVSRLPVLGRKACFIASHLIMLVCVITFLAGAWDQTVINLKVAAPATKLSTGFFYGIGGFFAAMASLILLYNLYAMASGKLKDEELIQIRESEEELDEEKMAELQREMKHGLQDDGTQTGMPDKGRAS